MRQGTIIWLNGTSSAGKSSIATAIQALAPTPYLHTGVDYFMSSSKEGSGERCSAWLLTGVDRSNLAVVQWLWLADLDPI